MDQRAAPVLHSGSALGPVAGSVSLSAGGCASSTRFAPRWFSRGKRGDMARRPQRRPADRGTDGGARSAPASSSARPSSCRLAFLIVQRATIYDGIRHVLFVIPMLAVLAGAGLRALLPLLRRVPIVAAVVAGAYAGSIVTTLGRVAPARICGDERARGRDARGLRQVRARLLVRGGDGSLASSRAPSRLCFLRSLRRNARRAS